MTDTSLNLSRMLDGGLRLRRATAADRAALTAFNERIHSPEDGAAVDTLLSGGHPRVRPEHFLLIEEPNTGGIVSSAALLPLAWAYDDIPLTVGMPEYVGTDPTYRKRGLMRVLMDALHRMSAAAGDLLQIVHGVPYFYRRFGYEYALTLWHAYGLPVYATPPLNADAEPFIVRRATFDDAAALNALALSTWPRGSVTRRRTMEEWRYELDSAIHGEHTSPVLALIDHEQQIVAACRTFAQLYEHRLYVPEVFVGTGVAYADVMPTLARVLRGHGAELARMDDGQRFDIIVFNLWEDHPALSALGAHTLIKRRSEPIYVRVPYLAPFLKYIAPALERRLAASPTVRGFSGAVTLNFYRDGLRLLWLNGKLTAVEPIAGHVGYGETYDAAFPPLVILKLLFGHRSLDELTHMYPDCRANDRAAPLLQALFPKHDVPIPF